MKRKNHYSFCVFLSTASRHVRSTHKKNKSTSTEWWRSLRFIIERKGSCRAQDPARVGIVGEVPVSMMNDYDEGLMDFQAEYRTRRI